MEEPITITKENIKELILSLKSIKAREEGCSVPFNVGMQGSSLGTGVGYTGIFGEKK
jgi:hypothetical protein